MIRPAVDDAVADRAQAVLSEPVVDEGEHVGEQMTAIGIGLVPPLLEQIFARSAFHDEPGLGLVLVEQALAEQRRLGRRDLEQAELDARGARVEDENRL